MLTKKKKKLVPSKGALEAISEGLKEIEAYFEMNGFSASQEHPPVEQLPEDEGEEEEVKEKDDEESEGSGASTFDREDIEVAIDAFISELARQKVIKKPQPRRHPTLAGIFETIFGEGHKILKIVEAFEENIEGYFDVIGYDEMNSAYGQLGEIRDMINKEIARHA